MNRLVNRQIAWNAKHRDSWERTKPHRDRVTRLITDATAVQAGRLCVLGAGNCNDLDLAKLAERFSEVHLVDLDHDAMATATRRQNVQDASDIHLHGNCDVTGIWPGIAGWSPHESPDRSELERVSNAAAAFSGPLLPGPFDTVASVCLLSQLVEAIAITLGDRHPAFLDLLRAVRRRHLQLLVQLTAPGGSGVLISDIVSSDSCPELAAIPLEQLPSFLNQLIAAGNFFHGLNPAVIGAMLQKDPEIAGSITSVRSAMPWLWDFGVRHYAVVAFMFRRA